MLVLSASTAYLADELQYVSTMPLANHLSKITDFSSSSVTLNLGKDIEPADLITAANSMDGEQQLLELYRKASPEVRELLMKSSRKYATISPTNASLAKRHIV